MTDLLARIGVAVATTFFGFALWKLAGFPIAAIVLLSVVISELAVPDG